MLVKIQPAIIQVQMADVAFREGLCSEPRCHEVVVRCIGIFVELKDNKNI